MLKLQILEWTSTSIRKLRSSFKAICWTKNWTLANVARISDMYHVIDMYSVLCFVRELIQAANVTLHSHAELLSTSSIPTFVHVHLDVSSI